MEVRVRTVLGLSANKDQGRDAVRCGGCDFERAGSTDGATDHDQSVARDAFESLSRPVFNSVARAVERWRIGCSRKQIQLRVPHRPIERECMQEEQAKFRVIGHKVVSAIEAMVASD